MRVNTSMNLFELIDTIDLISKRVNNVEKLSHEPQNYREKCDEMEKRIEKIEKKLDIGYDIKTDEDVVRDWQKEVSSRAEMTTIGKEEMTEIKKDKLRLDWYENWKKETFDNAK